MKKTIKEYKNFGLGIALITTFILSRLSNAADFFVDPFGDDAADGRTPVTAWQTIDRVNTYQPRPGDTIHFSGGATFNGGLLLGTGDGQNPITVTSYGIGRATIASGSQRGCWAYGRGGYRLENLRFQGPGESNSNVEGIGWSNSLVPLQGTLYSARNVEVTGYFVGFYIHCTEEGLDDLEMENVNVHRNSVGMITGIGSGFGGLISNFNILNSRFCDNNSTTHQMTGIGINWLNVKNGSIRHCSIGDNGPTSDQPLGPSGILMEDCGGDIGSEDRITISDNEVYRNLTPGHPDNQGIVFVNSRGVTVERNHVYQNGNGIQALSSAGAPNVDFTIRNNVCAENEVAGIVVNGEVWFGNVYSNTCYSSMGAYPVIIGYIVGSSYLICANNIFYSAEGGIAAMIDYLDGGTYVQLLANLYRSENPFGPTCIAYMGEPRWSVEQLRAETGQEGIEDPDTGEYLLFGSSEDPLLRNPGGGGLIEDPYLLYLLTAYQLLPGSPARAAGADLKKFFDLDRGDQDFYGNLLTPESHWSIGADHSP